MADLTHDDLELITITWPDGDVTAFWALVYPSKFDMVTFESELTVEPKSDQLMLGWRIDCIGPDLAVSP